MSWNQGKWWDLDQTEVKRKYLLCIFCVTKPRLVDSGYGEPKSKECPICHKLFDKDGKKYDSDEKKTVNMTISQKKLAEKNWYGIWGTKK